MRHTALAFNGLQECGLFTTDKCTCSETDLNIEIKTTSQDILSKEAVFTSLLHGNLKTMDSQWILCTDVDEPSGCTDCLTTDGHCFKHAVRITFER